MGADLSMLGFTPRELSDALTARRRRGLTDEDEVPPLADSPITRAGDIWCLGSHRVACGDSTDAATVKALIGDCHPPLMVTDPPYGVDYDPTWRHRAGVNNSERTGKVRNDERADWEAAWALFPGNIAYVWHGALHAATVAESLVRQGFNIRAQIIWAKERLVIGRGDYHWQHEPCWYAVRSQGPLDRRPQANDAVDDRQRRPGHRNSPRHSEAGRVHAPADPEQQRSRRGGL